MKKSKFNVYLEDLNGISIYNSLSGGILKLDNEYASIFKNIETCEPNNTKGLYQELIKGEMIVDNSVDELELLNLKYNLSRFNHSHFSITIAPTLDCNFACPYCYEHGVEYTYMNDETIDKLIEFIKYYTKEAEVFSVAWYGGEPLLAMNIIEKITKKIKDSLPSNCKYMASMVTNGYLLNEDVIVKLKDLSIESIQITIDGSAKYHDSRRVHKVDGNTYHKIINNLFLLKDKINYVIRVNIDKSNKDCIDEFIKDLDSNNILYTTPFYLALVDDINNSCKNSNCMKPADFSTLELSLYKLLSEKGINNVKLPDSNTGVCGAISPFSFVIDPKGDLYKCWNDIGRISESVGTVESGVKVNGKFLQWMSYNPLNKEICNSCSIAPNCMGGCPHKNNNSSHQCSHEKYIVKEKVELFVLNKSKE